MNQIYKNSRRPLLWWASLLILLGIALLPLFSFAQGTNPAQSSTPPTASTSFQGLLLVLIPVAVPLLVAAGKYFLPNVPTVLLPILAPVLGALIDWLTSLATGHAASPVLALALGSAGVGLREIVDQISKTRNGGKAPFMALLVLPSLMLVGCSTTQRPPSAWEQKFFTVTTNVIPVFALQTNVVVAPDPVTGVPVTNETVSATTNKTETYDFKPNDNAAALKNTAATVSNLAAPGTGVVVGSALFGLFGLYATWRSHKKGQANQTLAQTIETGMEILRSLPDGAKYEAAWKAWMIKHQAETGTIADVSKLVANVVDNDAAKGVANQIVKLIEDAKA